MSNFGVSQLLSGPETEEGKKENRRPPITMKVLIIAAIENSPEKALSSRGIYNFIAKKYPYFATDGKRWRSRISEQLSSNARFVKVPKNWIDSTKNGNYWMLSSSYKDDVLVIGKDGKVQTREKADVESISGMIPSVPPPILPGIFSSTPPNTAGKQIETRPPPPASIFPEAPDSNAVRSNAPPSLFSIPPPLPPSVFPGIATTSTSSIALGEGMLQKQFGYGNFGSYFPPPPPPPLLPLPSILPQNRDFTLATLANGLGEWSKPNAASNKGQYFPPRNSFIRHQ